MKVLKKRILTFGTLVLLGLANPLFSLNSSTDSCLIVLPRVVSNPAPLYKESSDVFGFTSNENLDSVYLSFYSSNGDSLVSLMKHNIPKNNYIQLGQYLQYLISQEDMAKEDSSVTVFWFARYWKKNDMGDCASSCIFSLTKRKVAGQ